jgi:hypothetical protein
MPGLDSRGYDVRAQETATIHVTQKIPGSLAVECLSKQYSIASRQDIYQRRRWPQAPFSSARRHRIPTAVRMVAAGVQHPSCTY